MEKVISNKTRYLSDIVNYDYTTSKAVELELLRSYEQSVLNYKNPNSKNYNIHNLLKFKPTDTKIKSK
jgi:hypothetical protein